VGGAINGANAHIVPRLTDRGLMPAAVTGIFGVMGLSTPFRRAFVRLLLDEGRMAYLWRAVDAEGEVLDALVQSKRNKHAALKLMRKLLKKYASSPSGSSRTTCDHMAQRPTLSGVISERIFRETC
jgi:DDE domain